MNEVRRIVTGMLADPQPPPRPADQVLRIAQRAKRRRSLAQATAGTAALVLVLGVAGVARLSWLDHGAEPAVPVAQAPAAHGQTMARLLIAALPARFTAGPPQTFSDSLAMPSFGEQGRVRLLAAAVVPVYEGSTAGEVFAYLVHDGGPAVDLPVQVTTRDDRYTGTVVEATRLLAGGRLVVGARQGRVTLWAATVPEEYTTWFGPALAAPPLDAAAVAALAADPAMIGG